MTFLVDRVIPDVLVRQWVLSLPLSLRYQLAFDAALCRDALAVFIQVVFRWRRRRAASDPVPVKGLSEPVEVFELVGAGSARTRLEAAARRGLTRFVGRPLPGR
jgi:hypothetical protein